MLKKIEAVLRPYKIQKIIMKLEELGLFFYIEACKGYGTRLSPLALYKNKSLENMANLPRTKLTVIINEEQYDTVEKLILKSADSAIIGDGKIFTQKILKSVDISTKEINADS